MPGRNEAGTNTDIKVRVTPAIAPPSSSIALIAASFGPTSSCSMIRQTFSTTTMASSTTMAMASTSPNSEIRLIVRPKADSSAKVPTSETGMVMVGISVPRQSCRKMKMVRKTRMPASTRVSMTPWMASSDEDRGVEQDRVVEALGERLLELLHLRLDRLLHLQRVGGRQLVDRDARGGLAGQVGEVAVGLGTQLDPGHVADADQLAAAGGGRLDHDVLELGHLIEPAEHVDRELEGLVGRLRRDAGLTGGDLDVLLLQRRITSSGTRPKLCIFCGSSQIRML